MKRISKVSILQAVSTLISVFLFASAVMASDIDKQKQTILVFGASGKIGSMIVEEALARNHLVIGVSRDPDKLSGKFDEAGFSAMKGDVTVADSFASLAAQADAIIISVSGNTAGNLPEQSTHARAARTAVEVLAGREDAPYVLQIGGAMTILEERKKIEENLPASAEKGSPLYGMFLGHLEALMTYRKSNIDWTVLTPPVSILGWSPAGITDTRKLGSYRVSISAPVLDADGKNKIYVADLAAAAVDEIESHKHNRQRFTVGY